MQTGLDRAAFFTFLALVAFLPFGIAGQQLGFAATLLLVACNPAARARLVDRWRSSPWFRGIVYGIAVWATALMIALFAGDAGAGFRELRKFPLMLLTILPVAVITTAGRERAAVTVFALAFLLAAIAGLREQARGLGDHPGRLDGPIGFYMTSTGVFLQASLVCLVLALRSAAPRLLHIAAFFTTTAALVFTYTRAAWFAWLGAAMIAIVLTRSRAGAAALVVFAGALLVYAPVRERLVTSWDAGYALNVERTYLWDAGISLVREKPVFGWGLQNLEPVIASHRAPEAKERLTHLHSNWLQTAAAMGAVGLAALLHWIVRLYAALGARTKPRSGTQRSALSIAAIAALTAFLLHGTLEWNLGDSEVITTLYTIAGLALAANQRRRTMRPDSSRPPLSNR
ncbi:MAG: O-antigen ligase family protein [Gemmatimonadetes bacterium]|nr:O-antigen ligase family protein [Gemmatimonadota bacterium]